MLYVRIIFNREFFVEKLNYYNIKRNSIVIDHNLGTVIIVLFYKYLPKFDVYDILKYKLKIMQQNSEFPEHDPILFKE